MNKEQFIQSPEALALAIAVVHASDSPLLLLTDELVIVAASPSFAHAFDLQPAVVVGRPLFALGAGEWDVPELRFLLNAIALDVPQSAAYEMDLDRHGQTARRLVIVARKLSGLGLGGICLSGRRQSFRHQANRYRRLPASADSHRG